MMALRAMNNNEKANAKALKQKGFHIFWQYSNRELSGAYWATHHLLICQYCLNTKASEAIRDLERVSGVIQAEVR